MPQYLLDTNIVSDIIKGKTPVLARLVAVPMHQVAVSSITEAELLYGLAKCGRPAGLAARIREFLLRVEVLAWDRKAAAAYGELRAEWEKAGVSLSDLDRMIAAHAVATEATLVTRDQAFIRVPDKLKVADWTQAPANI